MKKTKTKAIWRPERTGRMGNLQRRLPSGNRRGRQRWSASAAAGTPGLRRHCAPPAPVRATPKGRLALFCAPGREERTKGKRRAMRKREPTVAVAVHRPGCWRPSDSGRQAVAETTAPSASIDANPSLRGSTWPREAPAPSARLAPQALLGTNERGCKCSTVVNAGMIQTRVTWTWFLGQLVPIAQLLLIIGGLNTTAGETLARERGRKTNAHGRTHKQTRG